MKFDVAIVGAGLAGALSASMLGRAGHSVALIDPHNVYPPDFRCEKIEAGHLEMLRKTGMADALLDIATPMDRLWVARFGRLLDIQPFDQYGFRYEDMVNAFRRAVITGVTWICDKVTAIEQGDDGNRVMLQDGSPVEARLVVLAHGLNRGLSRSLGISRTITSQRHSITIGFDMQAKGAADFAFPALQYNAELNSDRVGYLSLFRIGDAMRANLFVYHDLHSPTITAFRAEPAGALKALLPGLERLTGDFSIAGRAQIRPVDLEAPCRQALSGIVMVGDACFIPCPAAGKGTLKAIVDAERLCHHYAPRWLATRGKVSADRIEEFYRDELKVATDEHAHGLALTVRERAIGHGLRWQADRWVRFSQRLCRGWMRRCSPAPQPRHA